MCPTLCLSPQTPNLPEDRGIKASRKRKVGCGRNVRMKRIKGKLKPVGDSLEWPRGV